MTLGYLIVALLAAAVALFAPPNSAQTTAYPFPPERISGSWPSIRLSLLTQLGATRRSKLVNAAG